MEGDIIDTQKPYKKVGTHHGRFHADEVMATAMLKEIYNGESEDEAFHRAVEFASQILNNTIAQKFATMRARENVVKAYENRPMPGVMVLEISCPWAQALREIDAREEVLYVVHPNKEGYVINTVRKGGGTLEARRDLPEAWAGKRDEELGKIVGVDDAVFCHPARFIAGARSFDSIMKMAEIALAEKGRQDTKVKRFFMSLKRLISGA